MFELDRCSSSSSIAMAALAAALASGGAAAVLVTVSDSASRRRHTLQAHLPLAQAPRAAQCQVVPAVALPHAQEPCRPMPAPQRTQPSLHLLHAIRAVNSQETCETPLVTLTMREPNRTLTCDDGGRTHY